MTPAELKIVISAQDTASKVLKEIAAHLGTVDKSAETAGKSSKSLSGIFSGIAAPVAAATKALSGIGLAVAGIDAVAGAAKGLGDQFGVGLAAELEQARVRIQAFTKDSAQTEAILAAVRKEADLTPFSFAEMAKAAGSLGPLAQRTGTDLTELLQAAEALSASDPLQGFEGAVTALREAATGDLLSLRERFEVDTKGIAAAIQSGVPPIKAVTQGLSEMGINLDLVRGQAGTTAGRLSTFNDTLDGIRRTAGQPILEAFGRGLDKASAAVQANIGPLTAFAELVGTTVARAVDVGVDALDAIVRGVQQLGPVFQQAGGIAEDVFAGRFGDAFRQAGGLAGDLREALGERLAGALRDMGGAFAAAAPYVEALFDAMGNLERLTGTVAGALADVAQRGIAALTAEGGPAAASMKELGDTLETVGRVAQGAAPVLEGLKDVTAASAPLVGQLASQYADLLVQQGLVTDATAQLSGEQQKQGAVTDALFAIYRNTPFGAAQTALQNLVAQLQSAQSATGELASATDRAWQAMIAAAGAVRDQIAAKLGELAAFVRGLGPALQADAVSVGVSIVNGIVAGLNPSRVIQASVALAQSAIAAARSALDSHSPSGEFEAIGEDVVAGLADGIEGEAREAVAAVEDLVAEMQAAGAGLNLVDSILGGLDTKGQDALANFLRDSEDVLEQLGRKSQEIGEKAARAVADARDDAAEAIQDVREGAAGRALELVDTQQLNRQIRAVRAAFGDRQDEAERTYKEQREDADLTYKYERDLAKAKTDDDRKEVRARYREAQEDLQRRRQQDEADRAFRKQQNEALQKFNDALEDEALQRQITRLQDERDSRIAQITEALAEKQAKIVDQEARERAALAQSATDKLGDLKERFYDKIPGLNEATRGSFEALFTSLAEQVGNATRAVTDLAGALAKVSGAKVSLPTGIGDIATWANQSQAVKDSFTAQFGADAGAGWSEEHPAEASPARARR